MNIKDQLIRDHRTYHRWFRDLSNAKILYNADGSMKTKKDVENQHLFIVKSMIENKIDHFLVDQLDNLITEDLKKLCIKKDLFKLPREFVVKKNFISLKKDKISISSKFTDSGAIIDISKGIEMVRRVLKDEINSVEYGEVPSGAQVYDLALVRRETTSHIEWNEPIQLWIGDCSNKADGFLGLSDMFNEGVDILFEYNSEKIPFSNSSVSELVFNKFLSHVWSPSSFMREAHRVLVDGGYLHFNDIVIKSSDNIVSNLNLSRINKEFFAFWINDELLFDRPKFELIEIEEIPVSEEFDNVMYIRGTLSVVKQHQPAVLKRSDSYFNLIGKIIDDGDSFGCYKVGLKNEYGDVVMVGLTHPSHLLLKKDDIVNILVSGLEDDYVQEIVILSKDSENTDIDSINQEGKEKQADRLRVRVLKQDKKEFGWTTIYGVVAEPNIEDSDGHWSTAEDIRQDAHDFLAKRRYIKLSHFLPTDSEVVESYMSPCNWTAPDGQKILSDSWIVAVRVKEDIIKEDIENNVIVGFSKGGIGIVK